MKKNWKRDGTTAPICGDFDYSQWRLDHWDQGALAPFKFGPRTKRQYSPLDKFFWPPSWAKEGTLDYFSTGPPSLANLQAPPTILILHTVVLRWAWVPPTLLNGVRSPSWWNWSTSTKTWRTWINDFLATVAITACGLWHSCHEPWRNSRGNPNSGKNWEAGLNLNISVTSSRFSANTCGRDVVRFWFIPIHSYGVQQTSRCYAILTFLRLSHHFRSDKSIFPSLNKQKFVEIIIEYSKKAKKKENSCTIKHFKWSKKNNNKVCLADLQAPVYNFQPPIAISETFEKTLLNPDSFYNRRKINLPLTKKGNKTGSEQFWTEPGWFPHVVTPSMTQTNRSPLMTSLQHKPSRE